MKKLLKTAVAVILAAITLAVGVSAFDFSADEPSGLGTEIFNYSGDQDNITSYNGEIGTNIHNLASGGSAYCCKFDSNVMYEFAAPSDGTYTFCIAYIARTGKDRGLDYSIDDPDGTKRVYIDLAESDEQQYVTGTFDLTAGTHQFYVYAPTNMDDDTLKSCDVYNVAVYFTAAAETAAPETEAPAAETAAPAVETAAPVADVPAAAPQTSDTVIAAAAVIALAAAVIVINKKK